MAVWLRCGGMGLALLLAALVLSGCRAREVPAVRVELDGAAWDGEPVSPGEGLRVYITLDGQPLLDVPFDEPRDIVVRQDGVGENAVAITGEAVYMRHADCDNQDCVEMGEVTRDNLELRVMGGFIICLPHKLAVEVRQ